MNYRLIKIEECTTSDCSQRKRMVGEECIRTDRNEIAADINEAYAVSARFNNPSAAPCKCRSKVGLE